MTGKPMTVYGDGSQSRCFGFVKDVVRALVALMERPEAAGEIRAATGGTVVPIIADVSRADDVQRLVDDSAGALGAIDILVTNTGGPTSGPFMGFTDADWYAAIDSVLMSVVRLSRAVVPHMLRNGRGKIVNVGSVAGEFGRPHRIAYCASKGGAIAFTKALAVDLSGKNICDNALAPALIDTPLNATYANDATLADVWGKELLVRRWGRPQDVSAAALYLASDDADYVTGVVLAIDGGWTASLLRANELE